MIKQAIHSFFVLAFICLHSTMIYATEKPLSPVTKTAVAHFEVLDQQIGYGSYLSESLLRSSYMQDAWLTYLREAENNEEYLRGMAAIESVLNYFHDNLIYAATRVNFFNPAHPPTLFPQEIVLESKIAFLNTFKTGLQLTEQEREEFFKLEWAQYEKEAICEPFELNATSIEKLESAKVYNFALLPDGTVRVAPEKPGGRDYLLDPEILAGDFAYPNHTIIAGTPHQPVLSAGSLITFRVDDKCLMFISNKSGHFVPSYHSLELFRDRLEDFGINRHTVIMVPTLDLGEVMVNVYTSVQLPIAMGEDEARRLFLREHQKWTNAIDQIDLQLLNELSKGDFTRLSRERILELNHTREEATYMRSAYHLFTLNHEAPDYFHTFVKRFGKLKDAIKHNVSKEIRKEADWVRNFLLENGQFLRDPAFECACEEDLYNYLMHEVDYTKVLLSKEKLPIEEFHHIKKTARELGFLFQSLAQDALETNRKYFIYHAAANKLLRINQQMAVIHDAQVGKILHKEATKDEIYLTVPNSIQERLKRLLDQLGIVPPIVKIEIREDTVFELNNKAKAWYKFDYCMTSRHPAQINQSYNPKPLRLFTRLSCGELVKLDEDDLEAIDFLKFVLRKAEIAKNSLIFLDASHAASPEIELYISSLSRILKALERNAFDDVKNEAATMLDFLNRKILYGYALQNYRCTDQESFNAILSSHVSSLQALNAPSIFYECAYAVREKVQAIADLMDLYLQIRKPYRTLPTITYEEILNACNQVIKELSQQLDGLNPDETVTIPKTLSKQAALLLKRIVGNNE